MNEISFRKKKCPLKFFTFLEKVPPVCTITVLLYLYYGLLLFLNIVGSIYRMEIGGSKVDVGKAISRNTI